MTADGNGNTYTYNADGMITASSGATYTYDGLNQRVKKTGGSNPTETIYFGGVPIALLNPSSGAWTDLIYAGSSMIAEVAGTQTAVPVYRLLDPEGSLAMTTDGSGNVTGTNLMTPYGETLSSNTSDSFQFAGLYQDSEYGGDHAWFRNYSTEQSRWLSPDPYNGSYDITNPQSFNRYVYAMNNPLGRPDPSGLDGDCGITCEGENGTGGGGAVGGGGFGGCGLTCAGLPDPCAGASACVVGTPDPTPPDPQPPDPPSPIPPLVPIVFNPPASLPGQPSSGGGSSTIGSAPNNNSIANTNKTLSNCAQQGSAAATSVPSPAPNTQDQIEAWGGAVIGFGVAVGTAPEDGPAAPLVYAGVRNTVIGFFHTAIVRTAQKLFTAFATTQGCIISAGGSTPLTNPIP